MLTNVSQNMSDVLCIYHKSSPLGRSEAALVALRAPLGAAKLRFVALRATFSAVARLDVEATAFLPHTALIPHNEK